MVVKIPSFSPAPSAQCVRLLFIKLCFGNSALFISSSGDREDPGASCLFSILIKLDPALWSWGDPKAFAQPEETHFHKWNFVSFSGFVAQKWTPKCRWPGTTTKSVGTPMKFRAFSYTYPRAFSGGRNSSCRTWSPNSLGQVVYIYI